MNSEITLEDIKLIHLVYNYGTFTKAAEKAHLSQSALSRRIQSIEQKLEITLFHRSTRKIQITPIGLEFLHNTSPIPQLLDSAIQSLYKNHKGTQKILKIDISSSLSNAHLPGFIRNKLSMQDIQLRISQYPQNQIVKHIRSCEVDLAILPHTDELDRHAHLHQQIDDNFILILPAKNNPPSPRHFKQWASRQQWIVPSKEDICHFQILNWLKSQDIIHSSPMELPGFDAINHLVALGHGVSVVPQRSLRLFYNKSLIRKYKLSTPLSRKISIVSPNHKANNSSVQTFLDSILFS